jgi:ABC-type phosphate transport system auxiliary subunit
MATLRYRLTGIDSVLRSVNHAEIAEIEKTIQSLQRRLEQKKAVLNSSLSEKGKIEQKLDEQDVQQRGLCLRSVITILTCVMLCIF